MAASNFDWSPRAKVHNSGRSADDLSQIELEGANADKAGRGRNDCPYPFGSGDQQQWDCGFDNAHFADHGPDDFARPGDRRPRNPNRPKSPNWQWGDRAKQSKPPAANPAKQSTPVHDPQRPRINAAGRFLTFTVMGTFTVLSQQVWMHYSDTLLKQINRIPFLGLIVQVPMVGGVIEFFGPWFPDLFGVGVWALINACQSGKDIIKLLDIRDPWWVAMLTDWSRPQYVAAAYIAEITLNYDKFPLFRGGIDYLIANRDNLDMDLFLWPNVFLLLISVLSFEHLVKFFTPRSVRGKRGATRNPQSI
jgi:hypothetical protein